MRRATLALLALVAGTVPAFALDDMKRMQLASSLGDVLASEEACGLSYDQEAIAAFIEKSVPADDMAFPGMLSTMTSGNAFQLEEMSGSAKAAHCAQIRRVAKSYGFTK